MFKALKEKLKKAVSIFSKDIEEAAVPAIEAEEEKKEARIKEREEGLKEAAVEEKEKIEKKKGFFGKLRDKFAKHTEGVEIEKKETKKILEEGEKLEGLEAEERKKFGENKKVEERKEAGERKGAGERKEAEEKKKTAAAVFGSPNGDFLEEYISDIEGREIGSIGEEKKEEAEERWGAEEGEAEGKEGKEADEAAGEAEKIISGEFVPGKKWPVLQKVELEKARHELEKRARHELEKGARHELEKRTRHELEKRTRLELEKRARHETEKKTEPKKEKQTANFTGDGFKKKEFAEKELAEKESAAMPEPKKGSFLKKLSDAFTKRALSEKKFEELFWDLELILLENNVALEVIEKIKDDLKKQLVDVPISRGRTEDIVVAALKNSIEGLFDVKKITLLSNIKSKKPYIIAFFGVNGSGKTTTIAKLANMLKKNNIKSVIAASDTFRAAAIQQLQVHADKLGVKMIKHDYGADPAAVAFDAVKYAESKGMDAVLIDTAGRMHSNINLMDEMKKIIRVVKPDLKVFVGEAITGNDCVEQAKRFNESVGIDGIILCKADVDEKGGAAISVGYITNKPIMYLGTGQGPDDLQEFDKKVIIDSLGL